MPDFELISSEIYQHKIHPHSTYMKRMYIRMNQVTFQLISHENKIATTTSYI